MKHITVRDVPDDLARALEEEKRRRGTSLNQTVKELLASALGVSASAPDNGLGRHAATWTEEQLAEFERAVAPFEQVDEELWR